ncbi:arginyltransferase [Acinetobacter qingfengensis]|uniref:Aspartate/glutamate leucyltransferase n=1 Tax=Acinetobacter qingfengensis TaxID=1262585 RepID=A0A1E7RCD1_9GAMM|nr:arginyltransferase [Acinetobacter qingfengensis]KAA8735092.1 arginyltransferase [Acinetobacter qingfengensis]OEY96991.1 arginyltransferase [Acinetobacter qingfengensis]
MKSYTPPITPLDDLQYYITPPHDCSYLTHRSARMVFLDPVQRIDTVTLSELSRSGFRRSGDFIYRPECHLCRQCLTARIPVHLFEANSSQRKAIKRNNDLRITITPTIKAQDYHYTLYERYIRLRHHDGDMYPPSRDQFEKFLVHSCAESFFLELWKDDQLMSVATCDQLDDGLSAVYTFFEPEEHRRSLGVYSILSQIEYVKSQGLDYLYLGYWVPHSAKMTYKIQYTPLEVLLDGQWLRFSHHLTQEEVEQIGTSLINTFPSRVNK